MMKTLKAAVALGVFAVVAACSGGDDGDDNPVAEYASDSNVAASLAAEVSSMTATGVAEMPTTGRADYDGVVGMAFGGRPASLSKADMIGDLDMDADFATNRVTAELNDFNTRSGQEMHGELRMVNGQINGSGFSGDVSGNLTGGSTSPGNVSGNISGDFLGNNAEAVAGGGSATSDGGQLGLTIVGHRYRD